MYIFFFQKSCCVTIAEIAFDFEILCHWNFPHGNWGFGDSHNSIMCRIIKQVTKALVALRPQFIKLPTTNDDLMLIRRQFYESAGFPGVVGAVDCTHMKIQSPGMYYIDKF